MGRAGGMEEKLIYKVQDCSPGPDLSSPGVGALRLPLEEVRRRLAPEQVQKSGFKNSPPWQGIVSHWSASKDGGGRVADSIYIFWLAWDSHPHSKIWLTKPP